MDAAPPRAVSLAASKTRHDSTISLLQPAPAKLSSLVPLSYSTQQDSPRSSVDPKPFLDSLEIAANIQQDAQEFQQLFMQRVLEVRVWEGLVGCGCKC